MNISSRVAVGAAVAVIGAVAAALAPKDDVVTFLANFAWSFLLPAAALLVALARGVQPAFVAGMGLALAIFLAGFDAWVRYFVPAREGGMAWNAYLFAVPGGLVGALVADWFARRRSAAAAKVFVLGLIGTTAGLAFALIGLFSTL